MSRRKVAKRQGAAFAAEDARKNLKVEHRGLVATVRNDITIPLYNGVLQPLDDTLIQRGGGKGLKIYEEVERDTHAFSVLMKRKNELVAREWEVVPVSETASDKAVAVFLTEKLKGIAFDRLCRDLLDATLKGFSTVEVVWGRTENAILPVRFVDHDQRRFAFDEDFQLRLLTRENMREGIAVPDRKIIVHRVGVKGNNPYGLGLGSRLFWPVLFKREGIAFWMTFLDKYASPSPIGKTPVGMEPGEQLKVLQMLEAIAQGYGITVPIGTEVEFLEAKRSASASYEEWARYWDEQMSVCVLGETLSTIVGSVGSQAAATVHSEGKSQLIDSDGDLLADTLQETLIRWIVEFNFPGRGVPKVVRLRAKNEEALAKARSEIAKAEKAEIDSFNAARGLVEGMDEKTAIGVMRVVSALAARMEEQALAAILRTPRPRAPADPAAPKKPGEEKGEDPEPAAAFAAPGDILDKPHFPDAILDAFTPALDAAMADWLIDLRERLGKAVDLSAAKALANAERGAGSPKRLVAVLADAILFANMVGRASVVSEAEEDGVTRGELFGTSFADEPEIVFEGAPFEKALEYLRQKIPTPTKVWGELKASAHDRAFAVAGETKVEVLDDIRSMITRSLETGSGIRGFQADFEALIAGGKWTGDPRLADEPDRAAWRAKVIYHTNVSVSHAAGRRQLQQSVTHVLPFWQYRHGETRTPTHPRVRHVRLHGTTLPADDPVWKRIYAPNGWFCSCGVRAITARMADRAPANHRVAPTEDEIAAAIDHEWQHAPGGDLDGEAG